MPNVFLFSSVQSSCIVLCGVVYLGWSEYLHLAVSMVLLFFVLCFSHVLPSPLLLFSLYSYLCFPAVVTGMAMYFPLDVLHAQRL